MESAADTLSNGGNVARGQVNNFLDSVEELTKSLKDIDAPEIARLRAKVKIALLAARGAALDTAIQLRAQARQVGFRTDSFVRANPWQVVGIAALVGLAVGMFASRARD
jgi:ElaB protein